MNVHELPRNMAIALSLLAIGSIFLGFFSKDLFVGLGTDFWNQSIFILPTNNQQFDAECIPQIIKLLPFFGSMFAVVLANYLFFINASWLNFGSMNLKSLYDFLSYKWYFDVIYNKLINLPLLRFCYSTVFKIIDKGFLEHSGPHFFSTLISFFSFNVKQMQTGYVYRYGYFMIFFFVISVIFINLYAR